MALSKLMGREGGRRGRPSWVWAQIVSQTVRGPAALVSTWTNLFSWDSPPGLRGLVSVPLSGGPFSPFQPPDRGQQKGGTQPVLGGI